MVPVEEAEEAEDESSSGNSGNSTIWSVSRSPPVSAVSAMAPNFALAHFFWSSLIAPFRHTKPAGDVRDRGSYRNGRSTSSRVSERSP